MIESFGNRLAEDLFLDRQSRETRNKLRLQLTALDAAMRPSDLSAPGWRLHPLVGQYNGFFSITVNGNWRLIFRFGGPDVELVDYLDYH